ncbi:MAG: hypothetical protein J0M20_12145 [Burkholderiales bacterium]|nr:hypothetical protein [Burkholderiales bacterium]
MSSILFAPLVLVGALAMSHTAAAAKTEPALSRTAVASLMVDSPQGQLSVVVDSAGRFTDASIYTAEDGSTKDLVFASIAGPNWEAEDNGWIRNVNAHETRGGFSAQGLQIDLQQRLETGPIPGSYLLTQRYTMRNPTDTTIAAAMSRYLDSDILSDEGQRDIGFIPGPGAWSYLLDRSEPRADVLTQFVGIWTTGGQQRRAVVRGCCEWLAVEAIEHRMVDGDTTGDRLSDSSDDRTLTNQRTIAVPGRQTVVYTTRTLLGRSHLSSLGELPTGSKPD